MAGFIALTCLPLFLIHEAIPPILQLPFFFFLLSQKKKKAKDREMKVMLLMLKVLNAPEHALLKGCFFPPFFFPPLRTRTFFFFCNPRLIPLNRYGWFS